MLETDLFQPVSDFLVKAGFSVRSEVVYCDILARRGDELVAVELKKQLSLALLAQAVKRQKSADAVYMAVPKPPNFGRNKKWRDLIHLVRRLELGLIFIKIGRKKQQVEVVIEAVAFDREKSRQAHKKVRTAMLAEMNGRHADRNRGGSTRTKLMTAYKENCIKIAVYLDLHGPRSPKQLRSLGTDPKKTRNILYHNHYGWFEHPKKGLYELNDKGRKELLSYPDLIDLFKSEYSHSSL
jgi:hypothetical protein